uniref:Uncharacterized protein n=1 Tax=Pseudomonas phage Touem01 TaxID=3138548 RepID=A0AAU6W1H8_9VIRU
MKLIDILVTKMKNWPNPINALVQNQGGEIYPFQGDGLTIISTLELADDWDYAVVTRKAWLEAREALIEPQWIGEGLPPVGAVCEFAMHDSGDWEKVEIIAHHNGYAVIAIASTDGFNVDVADRHEIRPIRTAEHIAAEEREKAALEMLPFIAVFDPVPVDIAYELYDAGYRKQVAP